MALSNFVYTEAADESEVTFNFAGGTVTVAGEEVSSGDKVSIDSTNGAALVATPSDGYKFLGWVNGNTNVLISSDSSYTLKPTENMTVKAAFGSVSSKAWFKVGDYLVDDLNVAVTLGSVVIPVYDGTLPAGDYTIPADVTLLIPFDAANTCYTTKPGTLTYDREAGETFFSKYGVSVYRTLTMANGAKITVNGVLSVSAKHSATYGSNGSPMDDYGHISMKSGSSITVNSGAALYAWGYITGSGSVEIKSGGTVYECFQIADYRGGDATSTIVGKDDDYGVFPFNQYYLQNVEVPMTLHAGAKENGIGSVTVTLAGVQTMPIPFIGSSDSMFVIDSGYIVKDYIEGTGRTEIKVYGDMNITEVSISMKVTTLGSITIDTTKYALPIPHHFTVSVESGNLHLNQSIAFLPGSEFIVKQGANCTLGAGKKVYIYDWDQWIYNSGKNGYSGTSNSLYVKLPYVPGGDGTTGRAKDALVRIDGYVDASAGSVYVTESGANIYSTGTGVVKVTPGTDTKINQVITSGTEVGSWPEITIAAPWLKNGDGTYLQPTVANTYVYEGTDTAGKWVCKENHAGGPASCSAGYTCTICGKVFDKLPHTEVTDAAVAPTCTATGLTEGKRCSVCKEVLVAQEVVSALDHSYTAVITEPTCTTGGYTTYTCSACGDTYTADEIAATGHTPGEAVVTYQPLPTYETEGTYTSVVSCSVCSETIRTESGTASRVVQLNGFNVRADAETILELKFFLPDELKKDADATVTVNFDGSSKPSKISELTVDEKGRYVVSQGVASGLMTYDVTVTFTNGSGETVKVRSGEQITDSIARNVLDYASAVLETGNDEQKSIITALLTYGGYAQLKFNKDVDNPAYNLLTEKSLTVPDISGVTFTEAIEKPDTAIGGIQQTTQEAHLDYAIYLTVYFTLDEGKSIENYRFELTYPVNGKEYSKTLIPDADGTRYYVKIENIPAAYLDYKYTITVTNTSTSDVYVVKTSVLAYLSALLNSKTASDAQRNLAKAMYLYNQAANEFFKK
ncbi:MAG: hypothetical protein IJ422_03790 [Oscillospiraceae bacterium]|nr:hypothetical protein [Oscillospiraceae bacterium]